MEEKKADILLIVCIAKALLVLPAVGKLGIARSTTSIPTTKNIVYKNAGLTFCQIL